MVEMSEIRNIYEVAIPPVMKMIPLDKYGNTPTYTNHRYLIFEKHEVQKVDGELIALFRFKEER